MALFLSKIYLFSQVFAVTGKKKRNIPLGFLLTVGYMGKQYNVSVGCFFFTATASEAEYEHERDLFSPSRAHFLSLSLLCQRERETEKIVQRRLNLFFRLAPRGLV